MIRRRGFWVLYALAVPLVLLACLAVGPTGLGLPQGGVLTLRLHSLLTSFVVGAALACAGAVFQAILRNPLAEPYILGVSSGAGLGAAVAILTGWAMASVFVLPAIAFVAAALTLWIVFALASRGGRSSVYSLILSGVMVSSICSSLLMFAVAVAPVDGFHDIVWWMLGNLQPASLRLLQVSAVVVAAGCAILWWLAPALNALTLGEETAHHVGVRTRGVIVAALGLASAITAAAVGLAGLIGFVGLIVPHMVRNVAGPDHRRLIPLAAVSGGVFLAVADAAARSIMPLLAGVPVMIPVGVVTALCGGPFFLVILRRRRQGWVE